MLIKIGERLAVKTRDDCSEVFTVEKLDDQSVTNHSGNGQQTLRARGVALSRTQFPGMTELDVVDEDDIVDDFDELNAGAATPGITIVCDVLSQGSFLFGTGWCKSCAFFTPWCISQELDVSSATFARLARRKEGCRFIVAKVRVQIVIGSEWSSAAVMFPNIATVSHQ